MPSLCGRAYLYSNRVSVSSRIVATLTVHLKTDVLRLALVESMRRFPQIAVGAVVENGCYMFRPLQEEPQVFEEGSPFDPTSFSDPALKGYLFKVSCRFKSIIFDFHKSIADEFGMMSFAKSVIFRYLELDGYPVVNDGSVKLLSGTYFTAEGMDPMERMMELTASKPVWYMEADAVRPVVSDGPREEVVQVRIPVGKLKSGFDQFQKTPVTYIAPIFSQAVTDILGPEILQGKYVVASIQVNLRPYFPAASLRPFRAPVYLAYNRKITDYPFSTVLMSQKKLLEAQLMPDALAWCAQHLEKTVSSAVDSGNDLDERRQKVNEMFGCMSDKSTYSVCRVGNMVFPESMQRLVSEFYPVIPADTQAYSLSVIVYRSEIVVTVSGINEVVPCCRRFVERLSECDIDAYISDTYTYTPMSGLN